VLLNECYRATYVNIGSWLVGNDIQGLITHLALCMVGKPAIGEKSQLSETNKEKPFEK
jgi:hypothetical protein